MTAIRVQVGDVVVTECVEWPKSRTSKGYGKKAMRTGGWVGAHRWAWEQANGPIPDGLCVLHRCDNPPCINPGHLFLGTRADNNRDMSAKGRNHRSRAIQCPHGHQYDEANTRWYQGRRYCRTCGGWTGLS